MPPWTGKEIVHLKASIMPSKLDLENNNIDLFYTVDALLYPVHFVGGGVLAQTLRFFAYNWQRKRKIIDIDLVTFLKIYGNLSESESHEPRTVKYPVKYSETMKALGQTLPSIHTMIVLLACRIVSSQTTTEPFLQSVSCAGFKAVTLAHVPA